jgi:hypothetical protein
MEENAMLDLAPDTEASLEQEAAREGVSVDALIRRLLAPRPAAPLYAVAAPNGDEIHAHFLDLLALPKDEVVRRNAPSIAQMEARLAEAARAMPEEIAQAESDWEAHKRSMNENRRTTGERLLYPDVPS